MDRSESSHVHHWAEVVTHPSTVASNLEEKIAKAPEVIELKRAEKLIEREVENNMRKVAKKTQAEAAKAQKLIDQEAEKLYIQGLSPEDKKRVKENKRIANQATTYIQSRIVRVIAVIFLFASRDRSIE